MCVVWKLQRSGGEENDRAGTGYGPRVITATIKPVGFVAWVALLALAALAALCTLCFGEGRLDLEGMYKQTVMERAGRFNSAKLPRIGPVVAIRANSMRVAHLSASYCE